MTSTENHGAHPRCTDGHVCQKPSGAPCIEPGCNEPAGTLWGPLWCPDHDRERIARVDRNLRAILDEMRSS
jgi:hypothetical protein